MSVEKIKDKVYEANPKDSPVEIMGSTVTSINEELTFLKDIKTRGILFRGIKFSQKVTFKNISIGADLKFIDCHFKKGLFFENCIAHHVQDVFKNNVHVEINGGSINSLSVIGQNNIQSLSIDTRSPSKQRSEISGIHRGFLLSGVEVHDIVVEGLVVLDHGFEIQNCKIRDKFDFRESFVKQGFKITRNSVIESRLRLMKCHIGFLVFQKSKFLDKVFLISGSAYSWSIDRCSFEGEIENTVCSAIDTITIKASHFNSLFEINLAKDQEHFTDLGKMYITSSKFDESLTINGFEQNVSSVELKLSSKVSGSIILNQCDIGSASLSGHNYSYIEFSQCKFNSVDLDFFYNYGGITFVNCNGDNNFSNISKGDSFSMKNSDLGGLKLFNVDMGSFESIEILNSVLVNASFANVKWFDDGSLNVADSQDIKNYKQKREVYRQLKQALIRQGDKIGSVKFKELEKRYLKKEKLHHISWWRRLFSADRIILITNQSNDYGLNFLKPIGLMLFTIFIFYIIMLPGISPDITYRPDLTSEGVKRFFSEFVYFSELMPKFVSPVHNLSRIIPDVGGDRLGFHVYLLDMFLKVFVAYLIFQTVTAFRKYL